MTKHDDRPRVLLVEDEEHLAFSLEFNLNAEGYAVDLATNHAEALARLDADYDLMVFDVMLPDGSGLDLCRELRRRQRTTPVLFLTAKGGPDNAVAGLEAGGDDYLTKPFALKELAGRLAAMLRRRRWQDQRDQAQHTRIGRFRVDFNRGTVLGDDGTAAQLTDLEARLLRFFVDNEGQTVSRGQLLEHVWRVAPDSQTRAVDNFVVRLRRLFGEDSRDPLLFVTVRGRGYRFVR